MKSRVICSSCEGSGHQWLGYGYVGDCEVCKGEKYIFEETNKMNNFEKVKEFQNVLVSQTPEKPTLIPSGNFINHDYLRNQSKNVIATLQIRMMSLSERSGLE